MYKPNLAVKIMRKGKIFFFTILLLSSGACSFYQLDTPSFPDISAHYPTDDYGRDTFQNRLNNLYTETSLDHVDFPQITDSLLLALDHH